MYATTASAFGLYDLVNLMNNDHSHAESVPSFTDNRPLSTEISHYAKQALMDRRFDRQYNLS